MTDKTARNLGKFYRALTDACSTRGASQCELTLAQLHPLKAVCMAITKAHALHVMTPELDEIATKVLADVDPQELTLDYDNKIYVTEQQQGEFMIGYQIGAGDLYVSIDSIKQARHAAGLTVRGLAEKIGVAPSTITAIEAGRKIPRADTLRKIADACNVTLDQLWPSHSTT